MEKVINIDGREVKLKTNGAFLYRYKDQFHRDALQDMIKLTRLNVGDGISDEMDVEIFYNFFWIMAKAANPDIKPLREYLEEFDVFPIFDILPEIIELTMCNLQSSKKK